MTYDVILADPCWSYRNKKTGGSHTSGAEQHYQTMSTEEIGALPIPAIAARHSVCFLWATVPLMIDAFHVLSRWDYSYRTAWFWHKVQHKGIGYWTRGVVEVLLVGVRGNVKAWRSSWDNWIEDAPKTLMDAFDVVDDMHQPVLHDVVRRHSQKPEAVQDRIEQLMPSARRVELFATRTRPGWDCYGLHIDKTHDFRRAGFWEIAQVDEASS